MHYFIYRLIVSLFVALIFKGETEASDITQEEKARGTKLYAHYSEFANITKAELTQKCMPKLTAEQREEATKIYDRMIVEGPSPINEGHGSSITNIGKILTEGGYSFPPIIQLHGPFLQYCGTSNFKRVLDIGAGYGADTMTCLL